MTELIRIQGRDKSLRILGDAPAGAKFLLKKTIEDIGDAVERKARDYAPFRSEDFPGEGGTLKAHPVDREKSFTTTLVPNVLTGGFSVKGARGRFVAGVPADGDEVAFEKITVAEEPFYAKFVHQGTGRYGFYGRDYGPRTAQRMTFFAYGRRFALKTVKGQKPQPYLQQAYDHLNIAYIPAKINTLKQEIRAIT